MSSALTTQETTVTAAAIHQVITAGDLSVLSEQDRIRYYMECCRDLGLNWRTQPFTLVKLKGGVMQMYLTAQGAEQLARVQGISTRQISAQEVKECYIVTIEARSPDGRLVTKTGGKSIKGLAGDALIDAIKKAETQAYRRAVRAIASLAPQQTLAPAEPIDAGELEEAAAVIPSFVSQDDGAEPAEEAPEHPLTIAKKKCWAWAQKRGLDVDELAAAAALMGIQLDVANAFELDRVRVLLEDTPNAKEIVTASGLVERIRAERASQAAAPEPIDADVLPPD